MAQPDYSFIRLCPTFAEAVKLLDPAVSSINHHSFIQLSPDEFYLQTSNVKDGIVLGEDYQCLVIDCNDTTLLDITANTGVIEFTDRNDVPQISFEIAYVNQDFYNKPVFIKFVSTEGEKWYSNPVLITNENIEETTRFDYKALGYFYNISYDASDLYQSIRLKCFYHDSADEIVVKDYKQITGHNISAGMQIYPATIFKFVYINPFVKRAGNVLLAHHIIYIDGQRCTNKPQIEKGDRLGDSNLSEAKFTANLNENETYDVVLQILPPFAVTELLPPSGDYTLDGYNTITSGGQLTITFNLPISSISADITCKAYKDGVLFSTIAIPEIGLNPPPSANILSIDFLSGITENGAYSFVIEADKVTSITGETFGGYALGEWLINIIDGEYDNTEYDFNEYLTN